MTPPYRLHYAPDNASLIIRLALEELHLPYATVLVDRTANGQNSPAYLALNPNGLIPVLETPEGAIFETGAILLWLADRHQALFPSPQSPQRGDGLKWLFFLSNTLHPALRMLFYPQKYVGSDTTLHAHFRKTTTQNIAISLQKLNTQATPFLNGAEPGLLDFYLATCLRWCALYPMGDTGWFDLGATPALAQLCRTLEQLPSVQAAIQAEGLGPTPFSAPVYANPPEGSAT